jgi:predicted helicase
MKAKIFYFTLQDEQTKDEKLDWFDRTRFEEIPFDHITPDQKANWINLTDNDFDSFLPLIDKEVKAGKSQEAVFQLFSRGVATQRDEWVYDFSKDALIERMKYFVEVYSDRLEKGERRELDIKWDRELDKYLERKIRKTFEETKIVKSCCRPYAKQYLYFDKHFNGMTYQLPHAFPFGFIRENWLIVCSDIAFRAGFNALAVNAIPDLHLCATADAFQCLPLYRYDANGDRIDNLTDWGLTQFQTHYNDSTITKEAIFHYTYAVLHHPAYRSKYELNLKREFPRLPFYPDFQQWATWGKELMNLHLNYEMIEPYPLHRVDKGAAKAKSGVIMQESLLPTEAPDPSKPIKRTVPKAKLKAEKTEGKIILDTETTLEGIPAAAWEYKLGNRSALEWILDQYKERRCIIEV